MKVKYIDRIFEVPVGRGLLGKFLKPWVKLLVLKIVLNTTVYLSLIVIAPSIIDRQSINYIIYLSGIINVS
ncbi:MAG: hypothetical protein ACTS8H_01335 [Arsenophonus sp. NC-PE1-MAG3]